MLKRLQTRIPGSIDKVRLDHFLMEWLPNATGIYLTKTRIRALILSGSVYVNRRRVDNVTIPLYTGAYIEVYYDEDRLRKTQPRRLDETRLETRNVVYEDDWLIVIDKPAGLPTQPTVDPLRANLFALVQRFLSSRENIEHHYVGLHHRLDRDTSGLVLFTKKLEANKGVSELFSEHRIQKTYQCLTWRAPGAPVYATEERFEVENHLGKVTKDTAKISRFGTVSSGGSYARTDFRVIESFRDVYWLEAKPKTGRTHQIRVHTSELALPILGDPVYFPKGVHHTSSAPRLMLHAASLQFEHPVTRRPIEVQAQLPDDFTQVLGQLKS